jgi:hypothetical protein
VRKKEGVVEVVRNKKNNLKDNDVRVCNLFVNCS